MLATYPLAFLAGTLTVLAPCALTTMPAVLGASMAGRSRFLPLAVVLGKVTSFTVLGLVFTRATGFLGLSSPAWHFLGAVFIFIFGLALLLPQKFAWLFAPFGRLGAAAAASGLRLTKSGGVHREIAGAVFLGAALGAVWSPCSGPILGSILTVAALDGGTARSVALLFVYALGAGAPLLAVAYGGQRFFVRLKKAALFAEHLKRAAGGILALSGLLVAAGWDRVLLTKLLPFFPVIRL